MSTLSMSHLYIARLVLETRSACSITTGFGDGNFDSELVRDANDLPTIPGSSLAGLLRHLYQRHNGTEKTQQLFGMQQGATGLPSKVNISSGALLNSCGQAAAGIEFQPQQLERDEVFRHALQSQERPITRDRVRLNHRGVAADAGKFDRAVLPAGNRFAVELTLWSKIDDDPDWKKLLKLLHHPLFRLGGNTRAGLGAVQIVRQHSRHYDLCKADDAVAFRQLERSITATTGLERQDGWSNPDFDGVITARATLNPLAFWRVGQGDQSLATQRDPARKPADLLPKLEPVIDWCDGSGRYSYQTLLVPGSSMKGAIAHRVAYHYNRLRGNFVQQHAKEELADNPAVDQLFGFIHDTEGGQVGRLLIDDFATHVGFEQVATMMHNAIDRFTGGVRDRMLFEEELIWMQPIELSITIDTKTSIEPDVRTALDWALQDLLQGRLALGSGSGKGHGYFSGEMDWNDQRCWIDNQEERA